MKHSNQTQFLPVSIGNLKISPDERYVVYTTLKADIAADTYISQIWGCDRVTGSTWPISDPGKAFPYEFYDSCTLLLSEPEEEKGSQKTAAILNHLPEGRRTKLFTVPIPYASIRPVGLDHFLISGTVTLPEERLSHLSETLYEHCHVITGIPYRMDGAGYIHGMRSHLWVCQSDGQQPLSLSSDDFMCHAFCSSTDSRRIYYAGISYTHNEPEGSNLYEFDLHTLHTRKLGSLPHGVTTLSATKETIYITADDLYGNSYLYRYEIPDGRLSCCHTFEGNIGWYLDTDIAQLGGGAVHSSGGELYMIYAEASDERICRYQNGSLFPISPKGYHVRSFAITPGGTIFAVCLEHDWPLELFELKEGAWIKRSNHNRFLPKDPASAPRAIIWHNRTGTPMTGWILPPKNPVPGKTCPGFLMIHEGPQGKYDAIYHSDMQLLSSMDYYVFFTNPRGGSSVSRAFANLEDRMGTIDYEDLMDFTDAVLASCNSIDPHRLAVGGISYGGYMTNWIIGHTGRFKTAVSMSSISNWISMFAGTDAPSCVEYGSVSGKPWTHFEEYWRASPLRLADRVTTPTLFIQGDEDLRCPLPQAQQMHAALLKNGIHTRLSVFPGGSHNFGYYGLPSQRRKRHLEIRKWLEETNGENLKEGENA